MKMPITKPEILGWIDKSSVSESSVDVKKYLKKTYSYTDALGSIAFPEHDMKRIAEDPFFRIE